MKEVSRSTVEVFGMFYWCLKIPKTRLAFIAQARPQGIANPMEEFMHHITFAKLVILCVGVCVCFLFEKAVTGEQVFGAAGNCRFRTRHDL